MPTLAQLSPDAIALAVRGLVVAHVLSGLVAIALGAAAFLRPKGDAPHRLLGRAYASAMGVALSTATLLLFARFNPVLAGVTALSAYSLATGLRAIALRRREGRPAALDRGIVAAGLVAGAGFAGYGALVALGVVAVGPGGRVPLAVLGLLFGGGLLRGAAADLRRHRRGPSGPRWWWSLHVNRMVGAYIALLTAFSVQALGPRLPGAWGLVAWIGPGVAGTLVARRALRANPAAPGPAASSGGPGRAIVAP